jgi:hypothetical protein
LSQAKALLLNRVAAIAEAEISPRNFFTILLRCCCAVIDATGAPLFGQANRGKVQEPGAIAGFLRLLCDVQHINRGQARENHV